MENIGKTLKETRIAKGIDLEEIEKHTKIRRRYLEALENEEWYVFPGTVYLKGFMRTYARYLGLDEREMIRGLDQVVTPRQETAPVPEKIELHGRPKKKLAIVFSVIAILILLTSQYIYQQFYNNHNVNPPKDITSQGENEPNLPENQPGENTGEIQQTEQTPPERTDNEINLVIKVIDYKCWVRVRSNGQLLYEGTLNKGGELNFEKLAQVSFTLGNAGDVEVYLNDKNLGKLGKTGDVVSKEYVVEDEGIVDVST